MDTQLYLTLGILVIAVVLFISDRLRPDWVALMVTVALGVSGVLTPQEAFSGLSRSAVITIMAIFILTEGLRRTGVARSMAGLLLRIAGEEEGRLVMVVMLVGASLSLFMNNIAAASVLLPAVMGAARRARLPPSRLLIPLSFSTILGGMATLLATTNIVVSAMLRDYGLTGYGLLDFAPVGLPVIIGGIVYMLLWGRHRLPVKSPAGFLQPLDMGDGDLVDIYRLGERLFRVRVPAGSRLSGQPLAQSTFRERFNLNVVAVERGKEVNLHPSPDLILQEGDILVLAGKLQELQAKDKEPYFEVLPERSWCEQDLESARQIVVEVVLAPRSGLIGQTLQESHFREKYGMTVLAIWRGDRPIRTGLSDQVLKFGDALLLMGHRDRLGLLRKEPDLIVLSQEEEEVRWIPNKAPLALVVMGVTLLLVAIKPALIGEIMLAGALATVLVGALSMDQAYRAIEWRAVFLIAGMLPMGVAITKTGVATLLADSLVSFLGAAGPMALLAGMFLLAALFTQAINGAAVAAVLAPIAIQAAQRIGADPRALAMGVALATSVAFVTPLGHPSNILVMAPGGYSFRDYLRVGLPLAGLAFGLVMLLLPLYRPLV